VTTWEIALTAGWLLFAVVALWDRARLRADKDDAQKALRAERSARVLVERELTRQNWRR
jgi:hypothetical protein